MHWQPALQRKRCTDHKLDCRRDDADAAREKEAVKLKKDNYGNSSGIGMVVRVSPSNASRAPSDLGGDVNTAITALTP